MSTFESIHQEFASTAHTSRTAALLLSPVFQAAVAGVFLVVVSILFWVSKPETGSRLANFGTMLYALSILAAFVVFAVGAITRNEAALRAEQRAKLATVGLPEWFTDTTDAFLTRYPASFRLWREMNTLDPVLQRTPQPSIIDHGQQVVVEDELAELLFNFIQRVYLSVGAERIDFTEPEFAEQLDTMRVWFRSSRLQQLWRGKQYQYDPSTVRFINELIDRAWEPVPGF